MSQLLRKLGQPERLSHDETERQRAGRLLRCQLQIGMTSWFDASPALNISWLSTYLQLHYDSAKLRLSAAAQMECRRPRLWGLFPWGESYDLALRTCQERLEDLRTLDVPVRILGQSFIFDHLVAMGDTPKDCHDRRLSEG